MLMADDDCEAVLAGANAAALAIRVARTAVFMVNLILMLLMLIL
jgi:hypothetical protein